MESNSIGAKIKFNPACNKCSETHLKDIVMRCKVNGLSDYVTSNKIAIPILDSICWDKTQYFIADGSKGKSIRYLANS